MEAVAKLNDNAPRNVEELEEFRKLFWSVGYHNRSIPRSLTECQIPEWHFKECWTEKMNGGQIAFVQYIQLV